MHAGIRYARAIRRQVADIVTQRYIRIVKQPMGEAPPWVRDAWIGLTLPLMLPSKRNFLGFGVLTIPRSNVGQLWALFTGRGVRVRGYSVRCRTAFALLEEAQPVAASWWLNNVPDLVASTEYLIFDEECCEIEG